MPLSDALRAAAHRTATDDRRFPPLSVTELPFLDVDVSLLHSFRTVQAEGVDRSESIEIGRHGVTIQRGQAGGLLLPSVAVENGWDSETFLRHVCRKAGLPSTAWQERRGQAANIRGVGGRRNDRFRSTDLPDGTSALSVCCCRNWSVLSATLPAERPGITAGATPSYYIPYLQRSERAGVLLSVELPSRNARPQFARMSMRPGLPLQATLFQLCEAAARWLEHSSRVARRIDRVATRCLGALHDSATHGTVAQPDLRGWILDTACWSRLSMAAMPGDSPRRNSGAAAGDVDRKGSDIRPANGRPVQLCRRHQHQLVLGDNVPRPLPGPAVRQPAVAGVFYPDEQQELDDWWTGWWRRARRGTDEPVRPSSSLTPDSVFRATSRLTVPTC